MFSIINEIKDTSPASIVGVIGSSIGSAASIYTLTAITGYLTFGSDVKGNIVMMCTSHLVLSVVAFTDTSHTDAPSVASTIGKAAIVILVTFSIPLQVHPCRASLDAVLRWRPNKTSRPANSTARSSSSGNQPLLPSANAPAALDSHGSPAAPMSDLRFALITTIIIVLSYVTALNVSSLDRVLAYVGSTGSTSISFILPGLFYYKISDPNSAHHQRLLKEDDDAAASGVQGEGANDAPDSSLLGDAADQPAGTRGGPVSHPRWRWRRKWRWDLEHLETGLLRKFALGLAIYGMVVMVVCLAMNLFLVTSE